MKLLTMISAAAIAVSTSMASAATYDWSYLFDNGNLLEGMLEGTLQGDNDTINVSGVSGVTYNGTAFGGSLFVTNFGGGTPFVTISGVSMGLCADDSGGCAGDGFIFDTDPNFAFTDIPSGIVTADDGTFDPTAWNISAVPLPASALLMLSGLGLVAGLRRRRRA